MIDMAEKKVLISGIHGFLGANAAAVAINANAKVLGLDLPSTSERGQKICSSLCGRAADFLEGNLITSDLWKQALEDFQPDMILHSAGTTCRGFDAKSLRAGTDGNYITTSAMIEAVISLPQDQRPVVLYPGSQMEYGKAQMPWTEDTDCKPFNPYGASKLAATELLLTANRASMLKACIGRIPIMFGPGQSPSMFIPELISTAIAGKPFKMTEGTQKRKFLFAADAASMLLQMGLDLIEGKSPPPLLNLPASEPASLREIAKTLANSFDGKFTLQIGAIPSRKHETKEAWPNDSKAKALGYTCNTSLQDALAQTVKWYQNNNWFL